ncbi:MAG: cytochrome b/b6 domain-containing protein [Pseudomonadales bacterium]|nr:cytochrome b/b6 domain-containing protein [Pseudomonadales bacterium]
MILVWDLFVRTFHWSLVISFIVAYLSGEFSFMQLHLVTGYAITALLFSRILWGFIGSPYARFKQFVRGPKSVIDYLFSIFKNKPAHYVGHNPAGGAMVITLLILLSALVLTGFMTLAMIDFDGPLIYALIHVNDRIAYWVQDMHHLLVDGVLILILLHIVGVLAASKQHNENLIKSMFTGHKKSLTSTQK